MRRLTTPDRKQHRRETRLRSHRVGARNDQSDQRCGTPHCRHDHPPARPANNTALRTSDQHCDRYRPLRYSPDSMSIQHETFEAGESGSQYARRQRRRRRRGQGARLLGAGLAPVQAATRSRSGGHLHHLPPRSRVLRRPIAAQILGHGPNDIFADGARRGHAAAGRPVDARSRRRRIPARSDEASRTRLYILGADGAARPRHVPAAPLRRPDVARGGGRSRRSSSVSIGLMHGPDRRLLPRHGRHRRLAPDRDRDGVPVLLFVIAVAATVGDAAERDHVRRFLAPGVVHAGADLRDLRLVLPGPHHPRPGALAAREGVHRGGPDDRRRATGGSCARTCCRTSSRRSSSTRR